MADWCKEHPRYSAKRTPTTFCVPCWRLYLIKNPEERVHYEDTYRDCEKLREHMLKA